MTPAELSAILNRQAESVCKYLLPQGKRHGHDWTVGDIAGHPGQSLKIVVEGDKVGVWSDFANPTHTGGDLLDLWMWVMQCTFIEAMTQAASFARVPLVETGLKRAENRVYNRPERPRNARKPQGRVLAYLKARGLTESTLEDFQLGEQDDQWILFPYKRTRSGELLNTKYLHIDRVDGKKQMRQEANAEPCLFGWHALEHRYPDKRYVALTEGECFTGDCEILTPQGWIRFDQYHHGKVAQWMQNGELQFVYPLAKVVKDYSGDLIEYSSNQIYSLTTPNHNLISRNDRGFYYKHAAVHGANAKADHIPRCGWMNGTGIDLTDDQLRLCIAISADAAIDIRKQSCNGNLARKLPLFPRYVRFGFKKQRKIDRLRMLLDSCNIHASDTKIANDYQSICFGIDDWIPGRILPFEWIEQASIHQRELILNELIEWDGNRVPDRTMTEYSTNKQENADFVQALAHSTGRCSTIIKRSNQFGEWLKVTILNNKSESSWQTVKLTTIHFTGKVYCVQVPSGALLVRQNQKVMVSGNCDAMTLHQCGIPALSVPNGGGGGRKQDWIENDYEYLSRFDDIYLVMDNDPPGQEAEREIIRRLGVERCRVVKLPYKDANECLLQGIIHFHPFFVQAQTFDPQELKAATAFTEAVVDKFYPKPNAYQGMQSPWSHFNQAMAFQREELIVWSGFSGSGKSALLNQVVIQGLLQGERFAICSLEMPSKVTLYRMVRQLTGQKQPTNDTIRAAMQWLYDKLWMIDVVGKMKTERILEVQRYAFKRYHIQNFIIDSLTKCNIREDDYEAQKMFVDEICDFNHQYECTTHLVVHQRKPIGMKGRPDKFGARGSSAITDEASSVICVHRLKEEDEDEVKTKKKKNIPIIEQPDTVLFIEKNRETGIEGKFSLWFDEDSLQFRANKEEPIVNYLEQPGKNEAIF